MTTTALAAGDRAEPAASLARGQVSVPVTLGGGGTVPGEYIVVLKDDTALAGGVRALSTAQQKQAGARVDAAVQRGRQLGAEVGHRFTRTMRGYAATLSAAEVSALRAEPTVASVQPSRFYSKTGVTQKAPPSWGLDRVDQRALPLNSAYYRTSSGVGVTAFVLDSGLAVGNPDFPLVGEGLDLVGDGNGTDDCDGHGTHVAGTIAGQEFGLAKSVTVIPMQVLDCLPFPESNSTTESVMAGLEAAVATPVSGPKVINMSLGTDGPDPVLDAAVTRVIAGGIPVVMSAGNGDENGKAVSSCSVSPARVRTGITVGATNRTDTRASWSGFGACVDVYAPGVDIWSDYLRDSAGDWLIARISGTSMAAPHVTGAVAMYLQRNPTATPAQVEAAIVSTATKDIVKSVSVGTRSLLFAVQRAPVPVSVTSGSQLRAGEFLTRGNKICSSNAAYCLSVESSGKVVLRRVSGNRVAWSASVQTSWIGMTTGGVLVAYDNYGRVKWRSTNASGSAATLRVNTTGYLSIVRVSDGRVLWSSR